jgi:acyl dehydratase
MTGTTRPGFEDVAVGDELPPATYQIRRIDLVRYAGASGDTNPIHWNERFAREVGLPTVIAHGMYTMGLGARFVGDWAGDPGALLEYGVRFTSMVVVPDDETGAGVTFGGAVKSRDDAARTVTVAITATCAGQKVLGRALATVRLP